MVLCWGCAARAAESPASAGADLDAAIRKAVAQGFSGAVLVAEGDKILLDQGYGAAGRSRVRPSSAFWVASIGKQFTSAAILKCQDRGLVKLSDPISKYLHGVPDNKQSLTLLHLLTHGSGLPQDYASEGIADRGQAVAAILKQPLREPPGTRFRYSNDNFVLAGAIVEMVTGRRLEDFIGEELLRPAGLKHTGFASSPEVESVAPLSGGLPPRLRARQWGWLGAGAMFSTTRDLFHWYKALRVGKVLSAASVEQLFAPHLTMQEGSSGLGWYLGKTQKGTAYVFTRGNDDSGANALIYAFPERQVVVVVLTHAGDKDEDTSWSRAILKLVQERMDL